MPNCVVAVVAVAHALRCTFEALPGFFRRAAWWLTLVIMAVAFNAQARELAVGDAVPALVAKDQFGKEYQFAPGPKFLLVGFDMGASKAANQKLAQLGTGGLESKGAIYIMDIHTMPGIARYFALPKMQKYPFRVILASTADLLAPFPHQPEKITVLALTLEGKIRDIRYWDPAGDELEKALN